MSINLTRPTTPVQRVEPADTSPMNALMRALSVAETVVAGLVDRPTNIHVNDGHNGTYDIEVYFHRNPDQVYRFAALHDVEAVENAHYNDNTSTYISADVRVDGVSVRGWSLMRHEGKPAASEETTVALRQVEDPHDSPLHHDYTVGHDLPVVDTLPESLR